MNAAQISVLAVLMLRGPQTVGELKRRTERLHQFESLAEVDETLNALARRDLVTRLDRRPGQKEERWAQLLSGEGDGPGLSPRHRQRTTASGPSNGASAAGASPSGRGGRPARRRRDHELTIGVD